MILVSLAVPIESLADEMKGPLGGRMLSATDPRWYTAHCRRWDEPPRSTRSGERVVRQHTAMELQLAPPPGTSRGR
jgi:hypothetical protein